MKNPIKPEQKMKIKKRKKKAVDAETVSTEHNRIGGTTFYNHKGELAIQYKALLNYNRTFKTVFMLVGVIPENVSSFKSTLRENKEKKNRYEILVLNCSPRNSCRKKEKKGI